MVAATPGGEKAAPPRGRRRRWRAVFIAAIVCFLLSFGVTLRFTLRPSRTLARWAEVEIASFLAQGAIVEIDDARIDARGPALVLRGMRIGMTPNDPDIEIARARIEARFAGGEIAEISRVFLDRPRLRYASADRLLPSTAATTTPPRMPTLHIHDASLVVERASIGTLTFAEVDATATEADLGRIRIDGTVRTPFEGLLRVDGQLERATGRIDVNVMTVAPINLARPSNVTLDSTIESWRRKLEPQGLVSITGNVTRENESQPIRRSFEVSGTALAASVPGLGLRPVDCSLAIVVDSEGHGRVEAAGKVLTAEFKALGDVRLEPTTFEIESAGLGVQIPLFALGPDVQHLLHEIDPGAAEVYTGLDPTGPVEATVSLGYAAKTSQVRVAADIDLRGIGIRFQGIPGTNDKIDASFPYPLQDVEGRISFREGRIALAGVKGRMGTGQITCAGEITGTGLVGIDLIVKGEGVPIDDEIRKAMSGLPGASNAWNQFTLDGRLDFDVQATRPLGVRPVHVIVRIGSQGTVNGWFNSFPVPVTGLSGAVQFDRGFSTFAFDGQSRNGRVRVEGSVDDTDGPDGRSPQTPGIRLRVAGQRFNVDDTLAKAFEKETKDFAELLVRMEPQIAVDFEYLGDRPRESPSHDLRSILRVDGMHGVLQRLPDFSVKLEDVSIALHVTSTPRLGTDPDLDVVIDGGSGRYRGHIAYGVGSLRTRARSPGGSGTAPARERSLDLTANGIDFPLDRELMAAVALSNPEMGGQLNRYDFGGRVDWTFTKRVTPLVDQMAFGVELRDAAIRGPGLPGTCEQLVGFLTYDTSGPLRSKKIEGKLDGVPLRLDDFEMSFATARTPLQLSGILWSTKAIDLASALTKCNPDTKPWLDSFGFTAQVEPHGLWWQLTLPDNAPVRFTAKGTVYGREGVLPDVMITEMQGAVEILDLVYDGDGFRSSLRASDASFAVAGRRISEFTGVVDLTPVDCQITQVTGRFANGRLLAAREPFLRMELQETPKPWTLNLLLADAELAKVLEGVQGSAELKGKVRLEILLSGRGGDLLSYAGRGTVNVTDATLFDVPGFKAIYQGLQLRKKPTFNEMIGRFAVRNGGIVEFDQLDLESPPMGLKGRGRVFFDGTTEMFFGIRFRFTLDPFDIVSSFIGFIFDQILTIEVVGYIENPRITPLTSFAPGSPLRKRIVAPSPSLNLGERF